MLYLYELIPSFHVVKRQHRQYPQRLDGEVRQATSGNLLTPHTCEPEELGSDAESGARGLCSGSLPCVMLIRL